ncbi:MAG: RsmE family RNA methyltransferase [Enhygromyxa sp.]
MSMRAFTPSGAEPKPGGIVELDEEESRYLLKVRRARIGEAFELFDGRGGAWSATLLTTERRARAKVGPALSVPEPAPRVLLLGLPDQPATIEALIGASELGATQAVLVACARSQGRVPSAARLERVLRASQRQCGRPRPLALVGAPPDDEPLELERALALHDELPGVFGWLPSEHELEAPRDQADTPARGLRLLVGPEGGLTASELARVRAAGFRPVSLGPWVLRTPTAAIALLAKFASRRPT